MDKKLLKIIKEIEGFGGQAYIAGGFVRDMLLKRESKDIDLEIHNLSSKKLEEILKQNGNLKLVGRAFGIYLLDNKYEFSLTKLSLKEACRRRDLTINSMLYNVGRNEIIDFFNAQEDLENSLLRVIDKLEFLKDPLRILRIAQFKSRFNFEVEEETEKLCMENSKLLKDISSERIFIELEKILLKSEKPSIAFRWMKKTGVLKEIMPEIDNLANIEQGKKYHPEGDVFEHTMLALDALSFEERDIKIMLAILYHDIGKAYVNAEKEGDTVHFYGHEKKGGDIVEEFLKKFTNNKDILTEVKSLVTYHMRPLALKSHLKKKSVRKLASEVNIENLMKIHKADISGRLNEPDLSHIEKIKDIYFEIKDEIKAILSGRHLIDLGLEAGNHFGEILKKCYDAQLEEEFFDLESGLDYVRKNFLK